MQVALANFDLANADFTNAEGLQVQLTIPSVGAQVNALERTYYTVNVAEALRELNDVGDLLRIAYAGTHGRRSSTSVIRIMSNYQHMVKDTFIVTGAFVISSLTAMNTHRIAMKFVEKGKLDKALEKMQRCAEMAREMATLCEQLKGVASDLVTASTEALEKAVEDSVISREEKDEIKKRMDAAKVDQAYRETQKEMLDQELHRALVDEQAEISREERREQRKFFMDLLKAGTSAVSEAVGAASPAGSLAKGLNRAAGGQSNSEGKSSSGEEGSASDRRLELMRAARYEKEKELRENNAILAKQLTELNQLTLSRNDLDAAIKALEVAVTSLGKIKTIFENTRLFWAGMEKNCIALTNVTSFQDANELEDNNEFTTALKQHAMKWMCLGNINIRAHHAMEDANATIDSVMTTLPSSDEARTIVTSKVPEMLRNLSRQQAQITDA